MSIVKTYHKTGRDGRWQPTVSFDKVALRRNLCRESFWEFSQIFWSEIVGDDPVWNWHMRVMCRELQKIAEPVFKMQPKEYDLVFNVPPGSTKSTFGSILFLPWMWTRAPWIRYLNGCFGTDLALEFGTKARRVIKSKLYKETFPEIQISDDQDTKLFFSNTLKGERRGTSSGSDIIGRHAHIQVIDDPIDPEAALSEMDLPRVNRWMTTVLPSRVTNKAVAPLILIMQRLAVDDPSGQRLDQAKRGGTPVRHICLPGDIRRGQEVKPKIFENKYRDGLLDPIRHPFNILEDFRLNKLGDYAFAGQYDQAPVPLSGGMFKVDKFVEDQATPEPSKFLAVVRWWDKAASVEKWGNFTVGVMMGILKDSDAIPRFWVLDMIRERWDSNTREKMIRKQAEIDEVLYKSVYTVGMEQEGGSGGKDSIEDSTRRLAGHRVVSERATGDKIARADAFATQVGAGNVGLAKGSWNKRYKDDLQYFGPHAKVKDTVDSSSADFKFLNKKKHRAGGFFS